GCIDRDLNRSPFFLDRTRKSLTYAAPFTAPLDYAGLLQMASLQRPNGSRRWADGNGLLWHTRRAIFALFPACTTNAHLRHWFAPMKVSFTTGVSRFLSRASSRRACRALIAACLALSAYAHSQESSEKVPDPLVGWRSI